MNMKKYKLFFGLLGIALCVIGTPSCAPDYETEFEVKTLNVSNRELAPISFSPEGGKKDIRVETNVDIEHWQASSNALWCKVEKQAEKVVISADKSEMFEIRTARVTIAYGYQSFTIDVNQQPGTNPELLIEGKKQGIVREMTIEGGEVSIKATSNMTLDYISIPDTTTWVKLISITDAGTENSNEKIIKFMVEPSFASTIRYSMIMLQSSQNPSLVASFIIKQDKFELVQIPLRADMLSTNAQEPKEGPIANLLDNNGGTYFHSAWSFSVAEAHYIQVTLDNPISGMFKFWYQNRNNSNGKPTDVVIKISADGSNWTDLTRINNGLPTGASAIYESPLLNSNAPFRYFRFVVEKTNGGVAPTYFNMAEFKMYVPK